MNENIDLTKILDGCPIGTEFYHLAYGKVWLTGIVLDYEHPIKLSLHDNDYTNVTVTKEGLHCIHYPGECVFFPSKDQRDWSKFERFWDKPKKERFDPNTLQPFDKVLIRNGNFWTIDFFSYIAGQWFICVGCGGIECLPYNEETKHLLGTTEDCPEYYKWWEE